MKTDVKQERRALTIDEQRASTQLKSIWIDKQKRFYLTQEGMAKKYRTKDGQSISQGAVGHYLNGRVPLNAWACNQFAEALQVRVSDFAPDSVIQELKKLGDENHTDQYFEISYYRRRLLAKKSGENNDRQEEKLMFRRSWAQSEHLPLEKLTAVEVSGENMWPQINDGDTVVVRRDRTTIENGKVYALDYGKEQRAMRVYKHGDESLLLVSDNPEKDSGPALISTGDLEDIKVIGLVYLKLGLVT